MNWQDYLNLGCPDDFITRYFHYLRLITTTRLIRENCKGRKIGLDIGCNGGYYAREMWNQWLVVDGIDPVGVPEVPKHWYDIAFYQASLQEYTTAKKYDLILFCEVIEHIPEPERPAALAKIKSLLSDNGRLIYSGPNCYSAMYGAGLLKETMAGTDPNPHYHMSADTHLSLLDAAGFRVLSRETNGVMPVAANWIESAVDADALAEVDLKLSGSLRGFGANFYCVCEVK